MISYFKLPTLFRDGLSKLIHRCARHVAGRPVGTDRAMLRDDKSLRATRVPELLLSIRDDLYDFLCLLRPDAIDGFADGVVVGH